MTSLYRNFSFTCGKLPTFDEAKMRYMMVKWHHLGSRREHVGLVVFKQAISFSSAKRHIASDITEIRVTSMNDVRMTIAGIRALGGSNYRESGSLEMPGAVPENESVSGSGLANAILENESVSGSDLASAMDTVGHRQSTVDSDAASQLLPGDDVSSDAGDDDQPADVPESVRGCKAAPTDNRLVPFISDAILEGAAERAAIPSRKREVRVYRGCRERISRDLEREFGDSVYDREPVIEWEEYRQQRCVVFYNFRACWEYGLDFESLYDLLVPNHLSKEVGMHSVRPFTSEVIVFAFFEMPGEAWLCDLSPENRARIIDLCSRDIRDFPEKPVNLNKIRRLFTRPMLTYPPEVVESVDRLRGRVCFDDACSCLWRLD
jgi:hypothetical protein